MNLGGNERKITLKDDGKRKKKEKKIKLGDPSASKCICVSFLYQKRAR